MRSGASKVSSYSSPNISERNTAITPFSIREEITEEEKREEVERRDGQILVRTKPSSPEGPNER